ncbi:MAG: M48 family metallopeptidase [Candidatus Vecturithrix sp.]|jgi:predicted Zn-dependent protease|nr:M48 family metallopeptidase [Candidatus Vecturithrix sp.]
MHRHLNFRISQRFFLAFVVSGLVFITSCATVPVTGRSQLNLIPSSTLLSMSFQQYNQFLQENRLSTNSEQTQMVNRVGTRIQHAVEQYFQQRNMAQELRDYQWEFNLVESKDVNAWCMPGGKVVVYTGILPITQDETGLAVVMGHEIAHAIAEHGNERMSQALLVEFGGIALSEALQSRPQRTQQLWMTAFGLGAQVGAILPYSRLHETEADHLGLIFMAMAGYDPRAAVDFWQRMAQAGGAGVPEFLSTHPSNETRIRNIQQFIPEALQYYQGSFTPGTSDTTIRPMRGGYRR